MCLQFFKHSVTVKYIQGGARTMSGVDIDVAGELPAREIPGWRELWLKEDWWAIWLGLGIVLLGYVLFANGASLRWLAVTPGKWSTPGQLAQHFAANYARYL